MTHPLTTGFSVTNSLKHVPGITHPMVADLYLKKDMSGRRDHDVLVIETYPYDDKNDQDHEKTFSDFLLDLGELTAQAREKVGDFSRVDIRAAQSCMH